MMFLIYEDHLFVDGNLNLSLITVNTKFTADEEQWFIIPRVHRDNYLLTLKGNKIIDTLIKTIYWKYKLLANPLKTPKYDLVFKV